MKNYAINSATAVVFPFDLFVRTYFCSDSVFPSSTVLGLPPLKSRSTPLWLKRRGEGSHQSKLHPSIWHPSILSSSRKKGHLVKLIDQEWNGIEPKEKQRENRTEVLASAISSSLSSGATVIVGFQIASNLRRALQPAAQDRHRSRPSQEMRGD